MKKIKNFYHNHKKSILALGIITIVYLVIFFLITKNKYLFASTTDYETQHYLLPEYFRSLFYDTKNIVPDLALNLGGVQNIYYLSYYGLLSPIILLSYFFPKIAMLDYLMIVMSILVISSSFLVYLIVRKNKYTHTTSLAIAFLFLLSSPIIYHAHRHIMFISYFPFLLLGFFGVDQLLEKKKSTLLAISIGLMILTSYYFSVAGIVVLIIYFLYKQVKNDSMTSLKETVKKCIPIIKPILFGLLLGMVIILPTAYCLLTGRTSNTHTSLWKLVIPYPKFMYTAYSPGITLLEFLLLLTPLVVKKVPKEIKCLSVTILLLFIFPINSYLLNGTLYINAKSLIPFLPLVMLVIAWSIEQIPHYKKQLISFLLVMSFLICIIVNSTDKLMKKELKNSKEEQNYQHLVTEILKKDTTIYRIGNLTKSKSNLNKVYDSKELKSSIYSSTQNNYYQDYYLSLANNNQKYRNHMMLSTSNNILSQALMGEKYIITEDTLTTVYQPMKQKGKLILYKNKLALPLGYAQEIEPKSQLDYPYNLLSTFVTEKEELKMKQPTATILKAENITYKKQKDKLKIVAKDKAKATIKLNATTTNQLIFITFKNDYNSSCQTNKKDQKITINNIENKLTCKEWKYHNQNDIFHYVLVSDNNLTIELEPGTYQLSDIKIELFPLDKLTTENITPLHITKIKDNKIEGTITTTKKKQFVLSIPYDKGYQITVDHKKVTYTKTNNNFIGFPLEKGTHTIRIVYKAPYKNLGLLLSILGSLFIVSDIFISKYNKNVRK